MQKKYKLNILIAGQTLLLLAVSLGVLFYFSHKALKNEAMRDAELTLESTVQNIDNILLSVEQATGNVYYSLPSRINNPEALELYRRKLIDSNP